MTTAGGWICSCNWDIIAWPVGCFTKYRFSLATAYNFFKIPLNSWPSIVGLLDITILFYFFKSVISSYIFILFYSTQGKLEDRKPIMLLFDDVAIDCILSAAQWAQLLFNRLSLLNLLIRWHVFLIVCICLLTGQQMVWLYVRNLNLSKYRGMSNVKLHFILSYSIVCSFVVFPAF